MSTKTASKKATSKPAASAPAPAVKKAPAKKAAAPKNEAPAPAAKKAAKKAAAPAPAAAPQRAAAKPEVKEIKPGLLVAFRGYASTEGLTAEDMVFQKSDRLIVVKQAEIEGVPQADQWEVQKEGEQVFGVVLADEIRVLEQPVLVEPEYEEVTDTESVSAALADSDACAAVEHLLLERDRSQFTLGGLLHHIRRNKSYERIEDKKGKPIYVGREGFAKYCEDRLNLKYRKAMALADIYVTFVSVGITEDRVAEVGWSKAWKISRHITAKNAERLLKFASGHTVVELDEFIETKILAAGESSERGANSKARGGQSVTRYAFTVPGDIGKNVITQALTLAADKIREDGKEEPSQSQAFAALATEWLALQEGAEITEDAFVSMFSARFPGKTITIA